MEKIALFCGVIRSGCRATQQDIISALFNIFGSSPSHISDEIDFNFTDYYNLEMGDNLKRFWVGFLLKDDKKFDPAHLSSLKNLTRKIEVEKFSIPSNTDEGIKKRIVNLDPGYLTPSKIILASTKDFSHRIYLSDGIYGEVTLIFADGSFKFLPWTYPDYKTDTFLDFAKKLRNDLLGRYK